jgi:hypothetical protein
MFRPAEALEISSGAPEAQDGGHSAFAFSSIVPAFQ